MNNSYASFLLTHIQSIQKMRSALRIQARFQVLHSAINQAEQNKQITSDEAFLLIGRLDFAKRWRLGEISSQTKAVKTC